MSRTAFRFAAALKMLTKEPDTTPVKISSERPLPEKREKGGGSKGKKRRRKPFIRVRK